MTLAARDWRASHYARGMDLFPQAETGGRERRAGAAWAAPGPWSGSGPARPASSDRSCRVMRAGAVGPEDLRAALDRQGLAPLAVVGRDVCPDDVMSNGASLDC